MSLMDEVKTQKIDTNALVQAVREIAAESPDYRYDIEEQGYCTYQRNGQPDCIVGHALHKIGVPIDDLRRFDMAEVKNQCVSSGIADLLMEALGYPWSGEAEWLNRVQNAQDSGHTWGVAVALADEA